MYNKIKEFKNNPKKLEHGDQLSKYSPSVLMHHGVKGQKWGVRRYQNKDGSLTPAGEKHVGAGKKIYRSAMISATRGVNQRNAYVRGIVRAKGVHGKLSAIAGSKANANIYRSNANTEKRLAQNALTKHGQKKHEARAFNSEQFAKYYDKKHTMKASQRVKEYLTGAEARNITVQRVSGRKTTLGKEYLNYALTLGVAGHVLDAKYSRQQKAANNPKPKAAPKTQPKAQTKPAKEPKQRGTLAGAGNRAMAKVYDLNARTYEKMGNKTMAAMQRSAQKQALQKAAEADRKKRKKN